MSTSYGKRLPNKILEVLLFRNNNRKNSAVFLITSDGESYPHVALLSPYQVVAYNEHEIALAVHRGTKSQNYLNMQKKSTLILQIKPAVIYLKISVKEDADWDMESNDLLYRGKLVEALEDSSYKAPFISELLFEQKNIFEAYKAVFEKICAHIGRIQPQ